jgi:hypothetical protein
VKTSPASVEALTLMSGLMAPLRLQPRNESQIIDKAKIASIPRRQYLASFKCRCCNERINSIAFKLMASLIVRSTNRLRNFSTRRSSARLRVPTSISMYEITLMLNVSCLPD